VFQPKKIVFGEQNVPLGFSSVEDVFYVNFLKAKEIVSFQHVGRKVIDGY
jgi:hypothetical protein